MPGRSWLRMMRVGSSPVKRASSPSMAHTCTRPPPREEAVISSRFPAASSTRSSTVLGWAPRRAARPRVSSIPAASASSKERGSRASSGRMPSRPATSARSVPWPVPVAAKEPWSSSSARRGVLPSSLRVRNPILAAPAVWDDDGPTIMGPMISKMFIVAQGSFLYFHAVVGPSSGGAHPVEDVHSMWISLLCQGETARQGCRALQLTGSACQIVKRALQLIRDGGQVMSVRKKALDREGCFYYALALGIELGRLSAKG